MRLLRNIGCVALLFVVAACDDDPTPTSGGPTPPMAGGATTIFDATSNAYSTPAPNLSGEGLARHMAGDAAFEAAFVSAPAQVNAGLGPVFNNNACVACHPRDGRGRPPLPGEQAQSMFLRISVPGTANDGSGGPAPVPNFGTQLFDKSLFGGTPMGGFEVDYVERAESFADGEPYSLRAPVYRIVDAYRALPPDVMWSPRVAPPVFGRGLLEAIPESDILAYADESDANSDGISGKPNRVWDYAAGQTALGRFGLKASNPTLRQQVAGAYRGDIGVTNPHFTVESSFGTDLWDGLDDEPELDEETLALATFYVQTLAVPARRNVGDPRVRRGEKLFQSAKCGSCHVSGQRTGSLAGVPEVSGQRIFPYTDLLLHDMGEGLADGRPDFDADGREWKTPPLWGIGLSHVVNGHTLFLHDGRARNLMEAVMWHGGEAEASREAVRNMGQADRRALIAFLESL
jgi:CxxC motif-containing protein (DUF1111 family)